MGKPVIGTCSAQSAAALCFGVVSAAAALSVPLPRRSHRRMVTGEECNVDGAATNIKYAHAGA
jgi:hypothetical protein